MEWWKFVIVIVVSYLIGNISFARILSKHKKKDITKQGSGNPGTMNMLRTFSFKMGILTLFFDALKGAIPSLIGFFMLGGDVNSEMCYIGLYAGGLSAVIGHCFPAFYKFKGGKGVATSLGVLLIVNPQIGLICLVFALTIMAFTRWVSLGSILAAILFPILTIFMVDNMGAKIISILIGALVVFNHRTNISRLKNGTENKLSLKK